MIKTYQQLSELYKARDQGSDIKKRSLESLECVIRMEQTGVVKTVCESCQKAEEQWKCSDSSGWKKCRMIYKS